jgi:hypothetical protein
MGRTLKTGDVEREREPSRNPPQLVNAEPDCIRARA